MDGGKTDRLDRVGVWAAGVRPGCVEGGDGERRRRTEADGKVWADEQGGRKERTQRTRRKDRLDRGWGVGAAGVRRGEGGGGVGPPGGRRGGWGPSGGVRSGRGPPGGGGRRAGRYRFTDR